MAVHPIITGLGHFHPETVLGNEFYDALDIGSSSAWIEEVTGIRTRRSVLSHEQIISLRRGVTTIQDLRASKAVRSIADMAEQAWQVVARRENATGESPDLVLCGTSIPDFDIPANACTISDRLKFTATSLDINSACSSFIANVHVARSMLVAGTAKRVALFVPERYTTRVDFTDRSSCVLWGDGCAAGSMTLAAPGSTPKGKALAVLDTMMTSDPSRFEAVQIPVGRSFYQNGRAVQKFAISKTIEITDAILERNGLTRDAVRYFVGHQANLRMLTSAAEKLGISPEQHLFNVDAFGNQGGAGAPSVLSMNWDKFRVGDKIVVSVVGAGLTWGAGLFEVVSELG